MLDLSHLDARIVLPAHTTTTHLVVIGCGGTGSHLAEHVVRLALVLRDQGKRVRITFIDADRVTSANVPRQKFCQADIGQPKAAALAWRYSAAWGVEIHVRLERFSAAMLDDQQREWPLTVLLGCVDNAQARGDIATVLERNHSRHHPRFWWLDAGNFADTGQVVLGCDARLDESAFTQEGICTRLPSPALVHPDLLMPRPEEDAASALSCAELAAVNAQSLVINQAMAMVMTQYLMAFLVAGSLRQFATYVNLPALSMRSLAITPETIRAAVSPGAAARPSLTR